MKGEKRIPKAKIEEGIHISLKKATEHLDGAELLVDKDFLNDAIALIEFAIEEYGRAVYLKKRLQLGLETVDRSLERNHDLKYNEAFSALPNELKTVWEGTISPLFSSVVSNLYPLGRTRETISPATRLDAIFISFDETSQKWRNGIRADSKKLKYIIEKIRENISAFTC